jgi:hypothetical protein
MASYTPRIVRFSLDLDVSQRNFIKTFAVKNELSASIVLRALIHLLETDVNMANRVLDLIFVSPEVEAELVEDDLGDEDDSLDEIG